MQIALGAAPPDDLALTVLATVVSVTGHDTATIDGGSKTFAGDTGVVGGARPRAPRPRPRRVERDVVVERMTEEHGLVRSFDGPLAVGERLTFVPVHACTCVNLADRLHAVRDGEIAARLAGRRAREDGMRPNPALQRLRARARPCSGCSRSTSTRPGSRAPRRAPAPSSSCSTRSTPAGGSTRSGRCSPPRAPRDDRPAGARAHARRARDRQRARARRARRDGAADPRRRRRRARVAAAAKYPPRGRPRLRDPLRRRARGRRRRATCAGPTTS